MPIPLAAIPIATQFLGGGLQAIFSNKRKSQRQLENLVNSGTPMYSGGGGIMDFYNKALSRYSGNPYSSTLYNTSLQNAQRATNMGLNALNDRRSALAGVGKLTAIQNDANLRAGIAAEADQARRLSQLGSAAQMAGAEEKYRYNTNQLNPYLRKLQLAQQKAGGAANVFNAGLSNMFGAATNASMLLSGTPSTTKKNTSTTPISIFQPKRDPSILPPSAIDAMRRRNRQVSDADYTDIPDYTYLDRGL